jgi:hypothetical protein
MKRQFEAVPGGAAGEKREIIPDSKVGLSLSLCVADILRGKVKEEEVKEIIAGTRAQDKEAFDELVRSYQFIYWNDDPEAGAAIAHRFYAAGKIKQPRLEKEFASHNIADGHWLREDQVEAWILKRRFYVGKRVMFQGAEHKIKSIDVDKLEAEIYDIGDESFKQVSLKDLTEAK